MLDSNLIRVRAHELVKHQDKDRIHMDLRDTDSVLREVRMGAEPDKLDDYEDKLEALSILGILSGRQGSRTQDKDQYAPLGWLPWR